MAPHGPALAALLAALAAVPAAAAPPAAGGGAAGGALRMKRVQVVDEHGFERPMTALTLLVPVDWTFRGEVKVDPSNLCVATLVAVSFRAASPDGRTSVELFPSAVWTWSEDPMTRQAAERDLRMKAQLGRRGCPLAPPLSARDYLTRFVVSPARPGARVAGSEVDPDAARAVAQRVREVEAETRRAGLPGRLTGDTVRLRVEYDRQGAPQEEWFTGVTFARGAPAPTFDPRTGAMGQAVSYVCAAEYLFGAAAPRGRLAASERLFRAIVGSVRVDPAWEARVRQVQAGMQAAEAKGVRDRARIIAQSAEDARRIMGEAHASRQASQDRVAHEWSQVMRGVETFRDPRSGETVELSNRYGNAWSNGRGEYLLSEQQGFDPNAVSNEGWTRLEAVRP